MIYYPPLRMGKMKPEGLGGRMLPGRARSVRLFCNIDVSALAAVLFVLAFVMMLTESAPHHYGYGPDLPRVSHAVSMAGADREDAMMIAVMRDGVVYFGRDKVRPQDLGLKIQDRLKDKSVERRVYIRADARVWYRNVKEVLDGLRSAGIERAAFLVDQRRPSAPGL